MVASIEGARVDADLEAQLSPDDALLVRAALHLDNLDDVQDSEDEERDEDEGDDGSEKGEADEEEADLYGEEEEEIVRLRGELDRSGRLQAALERYLDLL